MGYFKFDNKKVYYTIKGEGEPLLFIHGNTMSSKMFVTVLKLYTKKYKVIRIDLPGHGKSERINQFETDFWYYNSKVCNALLNHLKIKLVTVIGTSGGALIGINLALENSDKIKLLIADSFEGEYPLKSYIENIEKDRKSDKKKFLAKVIWFYLHGFGWKKVVDADTKINVNFSKMGKSFFQKSITELAVPTYLTGSKEDEYCNHLETIYEKLAIKNINIQIHMFEKGKHPAMITSGMEFSKFINLINK
jgi:valacyclovir hydrolase